MPSGPVRSKSKTPRNPRTRRAAARSGKPTADAEPAKIQKSLYFEAGEWRAVRKAAFEQECSYSRIVRSAVRSALGLPRLSS